MNNVFLLYFHSITFFVLLVSWTVAEIVNGGIEISKKMKEPKNKSEHSIGETIVLIIILVVVVSVILWFVKNYVLKHSLGSTVFVIIYGLIYAYIAIKQMIKMIFIPEKKAFSVSDIEGFVATYFFWWLMVLVMSASQSKIDLLDKISLGYKELVKVALLLLCYYFNILFGLGGWYIFLHYLSKIGNRLDGKISLSRRKIKKLIDIICNRWKQGEKFSGVKICMLWKENKKSILYKMCMTIPLLLFDIWNVTWIFVKMFVRMTIVVVIKSIFDPIKALCKLIKRVWNMHENNEWMYIFAQVAGLCSYVIVFLIIQYGDYNDSTKNVFEFAGTIILIPYFLDKIMGLKKNPSQNEERLVNKEEMKVE